MAWTTRTKPDLGEGFVLMEDGTSYILMEDGVSKILLESYIWTTRIKPTN